MNPCTNLTVFLSAECGEGHFLDKEKEKYRRAGNQCCVQPSIFLIALEYKQRKSAAWFCCLAYAKKRDELRFKQSNVSFCKLAAILTCPFFSTHCTFPWYPMCMHTGCPVCQWASVQNYRHLNTAAGVLPASIIGHMQRMTVADKAPTAVSLIHTFLYLMFLFRCWCLVDWNTGICLELCICSQKLDHPEN